jgi:drug/metabolite transporter (DMT)-like permease
MLISSKYLILGTVVLCWTLTPFTRKRAIGKLTSSEYFVVNFILTATLAALYWVYLVTTGETGVEVWSGMTRSQVTWALVAALLSIVGAIGLIELIRRYQVSHILPQIQPLVLVLTLVSGVVLFKERIGRAKAFGGALIILGVWLMNRRSEKY